MGRVYKQEPEATIPNRSTVEKLKQKSFLGNSPNYVPFADVDRESYYSKSKQKSMIWNNLKKGKCPNEDCQELLEERSRTVSCKNCFFEMRMSKYLNVIKGKESTAYKKKVRSFEKIKEYKQKQNDRIVLAAENAIREKIGNLMRMLHKGTITKELFDVKMKPLLK